MKKRVMILVQVVFLFAIACTTNVDANQETVTLHAVLNLPRDHAVSRFATQAICNLPDEQYLHCAAYH